MRKLATLVAVVGAFILGSGQTPAARAGQRNSGVSTVCGSFTISIDLIFTTIDIERPDEGWAWVDPARKIRQVSGIARNPHLAANDTPANHESHDVDFEIELDPGQDDLLSTQSDEAIGIEWESGIKPSEKYGDGVSPTFPKWVWPSDGDRAWTEGNWIFDCGHPSNGLYHTEIHPPRAFASMRDQAAPLPGTGVTPVPVTLTDLYITGRGGYTPQQLNCGPGIIIGDGGDSCGQPTPPADESYKTTPINDTNFTFDVCLPPRPPNAVFSHRVDIGPRNTVGIEPLITVVTAAGACATDVKFDNGVMMRVTAPLKNTATPPEAVYARHIYAGWLRPPDTVLAHRRVTVDSTNLHEDHDLDPGDGELTFWWVNLDRAAGAWLRLSDFANGNMDDYDDDTLFGDGEMNYTGAAFDFYLREGQTFTVRSRGFEQDCFDNGNFFGHHHLSLLMYALCYSDPFDPGAGDPIADVDAELSAGDLGLQTLQSGDDEYELRVTVNEVPIDLEDTAYLSIGTSCAPAGEVALVGQPLSCATRVDNAGPGLPRHVQVTSTVSGPPAAVVSSGTWSIPAPFGNGTYACSPFGTQAVCRPDSVPVAAHTPVNVKTVATPAAPGIMTERAEVTTDSTDPDLANNVASTTIEVFQSVQVDIEPGDAANVINLKRGGSVAVAILTTGTFDAASVNALSICFGDTEAPAERNCVEQHGRGHLEDVNKDKRLDLVLHFDLSATGIDPGDRTACLKGRTTAGIGIYGCDAITTK